MSPLSWTMSFHWYRNEFSDKAPTRLGFFWVKCAISGSMKFPEAIAGQQIMHGKSRRDKKLVSARNFTWRQKDRQNQHVWKDLTFHDKQMSVVSIFWVYDKEMSVVSIVWVHDKAMSDRIKTLVLSLGRHTLIVKALIESHENSCSASHFWKGLLSFNFWSVVRLFILWTTQVFWQRWMDSWIWTPGRTLDKWIPTRNGWKRKN